FSCPSRGRGRLQNKPIMRVWSESQWITRSSDRRKAIPAKNFHRDTAGKFREIDFYGLGKPGQIHDHENGFVFGAAEKCQHFWIFRKQKLERAARESLVIFSHRDDAPHPPQQR